MSTGKPIKRSKELVFLSRDHHDGLLLCWKIRTGLKKQVGTQRIRDYILHFFDADLHEHFLQEEKYLFERLPHDAMVDKALQQHRQIYALIDELRVVPQPSAELLDQLANELDDHIRYEERELFGYIEQALPAATLTEIGNLLEAEAAAHSPVQWSDEFWLGNNG